MFYFGEIDIEKSIKKEELVFTDKKYKYDKIIVQITVWLPFIILVGTIYWTSGKFFWPSIIFAIWATGSSYLKQIEVKLTPIQSNYSKFDNQEIIRELVSKNPLFDFKQNNSGTFYSKSNHGFGIFDKITIIICRDNIVYLSVLGNGTRLKLGKFFSKNLIKKDIEEALNKKLPTTQG